MGAPVTLPPWDPAQGPARTTSDCFLEATVLPAIGEHRVQSAMHELGHFVSTRLVLDLATRGKSPAAFDPR